MAHVRQEALQTITDSEEESAFSSEDDENLEDENFQFKERFDTTKDTICNAWVVYSFLQ